MEPTTPRKRRSPLVRYAPFIVIAVVIVIVAIVAIAGGGDDNGKVTTGTGGNQPASEVPVQFQAAQQNNTTGNYTWQDSCDKTTGRVSMPVLGPTPCVPKFTGTNGGALSDSVTADTIRIGYYIAKPDPQQDALLQLAGAYDPPAKVEATYREYTRIFQRLFELYGRKVELVKIQGTGLATDETAAKADADKAAKQEHVFAVMGGPAQAKSFSEELAANHVLCIGTCIIAQPQSYYKKHSPYMWPVGPSPDQTSEMMVEYIQKQLLGKNAVYAGDPSFHSEKRTFALLSYDTLDGQYKDSWDNFVLQLKDAGVPLKLHKNYFLDISKIPETAHEIAVALKQANATTVIFTGDPIMPKYFTEQSKIQNYFPEWIMAGTVFADTSVFARTFDQDEWKHAFGLQLTPARVPESKNDAYTFHQWYYGTPPPAENAFAVILGNIQVLFSGLQTAGPHLTPDNFRAGMYGIAPDADATDTIATVTTYGDHQFWPSPPDPAGLDNMGLLWWNPKAKGEDETGAVGDGMYELVDGGRRYVHGQWPTEPLPLFDTKGAVTIYDNPPPALTPKQYPPLPGSPAAAKG
jgi:Periplasmic binding protein